MPPRWSRIPTRNDPDFRRLDDRMTFATHVAAFLAFNSGLWFFKMIQNADWPWAIWVSAAWTGAFLAHALYVFTIATYEDES